MWQIVQNGDTWTLSRDGVVVQTATGDEGYAQLVAVLATAVAAERQLAAVDTSPDDGLLPESWVSDMAFMEETGDGRDFRECAWSWRDPQAGFVPLMLQTVTEFGHFGATLAGFVESVENADAPRGGGRFYDSAAGVQFHDMLLGGRSFGVSVDPGAVDVEFECIETDDDGWCIDANLRFLAYEIIGLTGTPFPGFARASITLGAAPAGESSPEPTADDGAEDADEEMSATTCSCGGHAQTASAAGRVDLSTRRITRPSSTPIDARPTVGRIAAAARPAPSGLVIPVAPPRSWFEPDETLLGRLRSSEAGTIRALDNGRLYGYVAPRGSCHVGYPGTCETPDELTRTGFGYFHVGYVVCDDGSEVATGALSFAGRHAPLSMTMREAWEHYENTCLGAADVRVGYDGPGLWIAGALRPDITPEQLRTIRGSAPSYDARPVGRDLELMSVHYVNTPGHPMQARVADGRILAIVASGAPVRDAPSGVDAEVAALLARERATQRGRLQAQRTAAARRELARR